MRSLLVKKSHSGALLFGSLLLALALGLAVILPIQAFALSPLALAAGNASIGAGVVVQAGSSVASASRVSPNTTVSGKLDGWNDDWYKVTLPKAGKFQIVMGGDYDDGWSSWDVSLRDSSNEELWTGSHGVDSLVSETLLTTGLPAGAYYIRVSGGLQGLTYRLTPKFVESSAWETESNDSVNAADVIKLGNTANGTISNWGDEDWYKVTLTKADRFRICFSADKAKADSRSWDISLRSGSNSELWSGSYQSGNTSTKALMTCSLKAGTYYIKVTGSSGLEKTVYKLRPLMVVSNPMTVSVKAKTIKYSKVKKASQTVKPITVRKAQGKVVYSKVSGNKKLIINKTTGKLTVKKGLKKGAYKVKIKVTAKGNSKYLAKSKTITVKIVVK